MLKALKKITSLRIHFIVGFSIVLAGLALGTLSLLSYSSWNKVTGEPVVRSSQVTTQPNEPPLITGKPVRIQVPSVSIDLSVVPGKYYPATQSWDLSVTHAHFGEMTEQPNNKQGLTFIYAHARKGLFESLPNIKAGETVQITTDNGHVFTYAFRYSTIVDPTETHLLDYEGKPVLVLQTCTGLWWQNRQLFTLDFAGVE